MNKKFPFVPKVIGWELTRKCNMRCIHCGTSAGSSRKNELSVEEGLVLCRQIIELGTKSLSLSGGEPLLHHAWDKYARALHEGGVKVSMITNGYLLEENIEKILRSPVRRIGISLDGTPDTHNFIRQNKNSFERAVKGARELKKRNISAGAITHVSKKNIRELEALYKILKDNGFDFWQIQITFLSGRMRKHKEMALDPDDMPEAAEFVEEKKTLKEIDVSAGDNLGYYSKHNITNFKWKGCFAGRWLMGIDADGGIKGCLSLPPEFVEDNIRKRALKEIWEDRSLFKYNRYFNPADLGNFCKDCVHAPDCRGGCTVTAYSATGSPFNNPYCLYRVENVKT